MRQGDAGNRGEFISEAEANRTTKRYEMWRYGKREAMRNRQLTGWKQ